MAEAAIPTLVLIAVGARPGPPLAERTGPLAVPLGGHRVPLRDPRRPVRARLAHPNDWSTRSRTWASACLMFLAGYELDLQPGQGPAAAPGLGRAGLISLALALGLAFALVRSGLAVDTVVVGLALTTTALGTLMPVLRDAGVLATRFGLLSWPSAWSASSARSWRWPSSSRHTTRPHRCACWPSS